MCKALKNVSITLLTGKSEHHDAFGFINTLPNEALQVEYLCHHLHEAYSILMETDEENQKNLKKWKKCIMDSSEEVNRGMLGQPLYVVCRFFKVWSQAAILTNLVNS